MTAKTVRVEDILSTSLHSAQSFNLSASEDDTDTNSSPPPRPLTSFRRANDLETDLSYTQLNVQEYLSSEKTGPAISIGQCITKNFGHAIYQGCFGDDLVNVKVMKAGLREGPATFEAVKVMFP